MRNYYLAAVSAVLLLAACKSGEKEKGPEKKYVSVPSIIEKQVAHIDTSLYSIIKVTGNDSLEMDTVFISREDFRKEAADFLRITDLSDPDNAGRFREESTYDTLLKRIIYTYTPLKPESEEIQKQQLLISTEIDAEGNNKITSVLVERSRKDRNGALDQHLVWRMDKSFLIKTTTQKPGEPEATTVTRVIWNEDPAR